MGLTLEVDAGLRNVLSQFFQLNPRSSLPPAIRLERHALTTPVSGHMSGFRSQLSADSGTNSRQDVGAGPGRRVLDVIVPRHILRNDGNRILRVPREEEGARQPDDARSAPVRFPPEQSSSGPHSPEDNDRFRHFRTRYVTSRSSMSQTWFASSEKEVCSTENKNRESLTFDAGGRRMRGIAYTEYEWSTYRSSISTTKCTGQPEANRPANTRYVQTPHAPTQLSLWTPGFHTSPHISQATSRSGLRRHAVPGRLGPGPDRPTAVGAG